MKTITLEQAIKFIQEKTDLEISDFHYKVDNMLILIATYDGYITQAICDNTIDSLLNLFVRIIKEKKYVGEKFFNKDSLLYFYLVEREFDVKNSLANIDLSEEISDEILKEKIIDAILNDLERNEND